MLNKQYDYTETTFDKLEVGDQFYTRSGVSRGYARLYTKIEPVTIGTAGVHSFMTATAGNGDNYFQCQAGSAVVKVTEKKLPTFGDLQIGEFFRVADFPTEASLKIGAVNAALFQKPTPNEWVYVGVQGIGSRTPVERLEKLPDR